MGADARYRDCTQALWALIGAARDPGRMHLDAAAAAAAAAVAAARGADSHLLLHEQDGGLRMNGRELQLDLEVFGAAQGLAALFAGSAVGELLFDAAADARSLAAWARCWTGPGDPVAGLDRCGAVGVHASRSTAGAGPARRAHLLDVAGADSRLRSVFLQHHLIAAIPADWIVPATLAKVVVQGVVDRLLAVPGGLEPLMLLQQDERALLRCLRVAVLAVVLARAAGCDEDRLADLGAAALLHDVGAVLDPARPGPAGLAFLLERGGDDFWLRSAIVARTWSEATGETLAEVGAGAGAAPALVRLAVAIERGSGADAAERLAALRGGGFPPEFVAVAEEAFAAMAG
ncbi:MAG: hypothetical protein FJ265_01045 [Planctomycetes bacterium]|nr:hypothetical protein [Planctomycetota bacterium]